MEKLVEPTEHIPIPTVFSIHGLAHVHKLKVDHFSFSEIAGTALARVLREEGSSTRIDIVLDVDMNLSIKSVEKYILREQRGQGDSVNNIKEPSS